MELNIKTRFTTLLGGFICMLRPTDMQTSMSAFTPYSVASLIRSLAGRWIKIVLSPLKHTQQLFDALVARQAGVKNRLVSAFRAVALNAAFSGIGALHQIDQAH